MTPCLRIEVELPAKQEGHQGLGVGARRATHDLDGGGHLIAPRYLAPVGAIQELDRIVLTKRTALEREHVFRDPLESLPQSLPQAEGIFVGHSLRSGSQVPLGIPLAGALELERAERAPALDRRDFEGRAPQVRIDLERRAAGAMEENADDACS